MTYDPKNKSIILVRNRNANFWYPPGGGLEQGEDAKQCAVREMLEETGLHVDLKRMLYAQEFHEKDMTYLEFFWMAELSHEQSINSAHIDLDPEGSVEEARWFNKDQLQGLKVYPERLKDSFWDNVDRFYKEEDPFIGVFN